MSYTTFKYSDIEASSDSISLDEEIVIAATLTNTGDVEATEVAQLYIRDLVGNVTRPVRELKGFKRVTLQPGKSTRVEFRLHTDDLAFYGRNNTLIVELGEFHAWIGGSSKAVLQTAFRIVGD